MPQSILILSPSQLTYEMQRQMLTSHGYEVRRSEHALRLVMDFASAPSDVVILDCAGFPTRDLEVIRVLRESCPDVGILVLAERDEIDLAGAALCAGADLYLIKPGAGPQLLAAVERAGLRRLSMLDALTELPNRRSFDQAAEREVERARRESGRFLVALTDVDHFKQYNDTYGYDVGDDILKKLALILKAESRLRRMDFVARYGGDEFVLLLPETQTQTPEARPKPSDSLVTRLENLVTEIVPNHPFRSGPGPFNIKITVSAGVAAYPGDGQSIKDLLAVATRRLHRCKHDGGNGVVFKDA